MAGTLTGIGLGVILFGVFLTLFLPIGINAINEQYSIPVLKTQLCYTLVEFLEYCGVLVAIFGVILVFAPFMGS